MPKMDGLEFLKKLMPQNPLPVVMVSALTEPGARVTLDALDYGAVDFVLKPNSSFGHQLQNMIDELCDKVKAAYKVDVSGWRNRFRRPAVGVKRYEKNILVGSKTRKILSQL